MSDLDDLGSDRRPLSLAAVLDRFGASTRYLVELKDPHPAWAGRVGAEVSNRGLDDRVVLQSFDAEALRRVNARMPEIAVAPLVRRLPWRLSALAAFAHGIGLWHGSLRRAHVRRAHEHGLAIWAWTANEPSSIERLVACGVDGIVTDMPDVARALVDGAPAHRLAA